MDKYQDIFNLFYKPKPITKKKDSTFCYKCKLEKKLDIINSYYVCTNCGEVSGEKCIQMYSYNDINSHCMYSYFNNYSRYNQFEKHLYNIHIIPNNLKKKMKYMFKQILPIFKKKCNTRSNFIRYKYVIIKMLELLNCPQLSKKFSLPKSKLITYKYDMIWKEICDELGWKYINSVCLLCIIEETKKRKHKRKNNKYVVIY